MQLVLHNAETYLNFRGMLCRNIVLLLPSIARKANSGQIFFSSFGGDCGWAEDEV